MLANKGSRSMFKVMLGARSMATALARPIYKPIDLTEELTHLIETDRDHENAFARFAEQTEQYMADLKEMNENKIQMIIDRGGLDGWETVSSISELIGS